jgi:hypothetical protein
VTGTAPILPYTRPRIDRLLLLPQGDSELERGSPQCPSEPCGVPASAVSCRALSAVACGFVVGALSGCGSGTGIDCADHRFDQARWTVARHDLAVERETSAERFLRSTARTLASCGTLTTWTEADVRARLGRPDWDERDPNPRPHRDVAYIVGYSPSRGSEIEDTLHIEFDRGRAVYARAPNDDRGGSLEEDSIVDGEPVGGGPRAVDP